MTAVLDGIHIHPVKAGRPVDLEASPVDPAGLRFDRRWMVATEDGQFMTRRQEPALAHLVVTDAGSGWRLDFRNRREIHLPRTWDGEPWTDVAVWGHPVSTTLGPADVSTWLSECLDRPVRLVYVRDEDLRPVDPAYGREGDVVGFADGFPLLLVTSASVTALAERVGRPLTASRFRPNLVVTGTAPFVEDEWARIRIGEVVFDVVKPCARCMVVDLDPESGNRDDGVLRALAEFRASRGKVFFGENLVPRSPGTVRRGDSVEVLADRDRWPVPL